MNVVVLFLFSLLSLLLPATSFASESLSFTPPPGDFSVIFLSNIFGRVDGVLYGTGSQIMGAIFMVFNSAVLALGGMIIMYTLLISTMNTAHEGEMLGKKWSSIWVPLRSTLGLALLIPKASGYCLMQIFVMWIAVQGVGAADKIWSTALNYLNRGGTIIQTQLAHRPTSLINREDDGPLKQRRYQLSEQAQNETAKGVRTILSGQVCMLGIQTILTRERQKAMDKKQDSDGICVGTPSKEMKILCDNPVPDFIGSVSIVNAGNSVKMPNFSSDSPYASLNGICGTIKWNPFKEQVNNLSNIKLNDADKEITAQTRDLAIQEMYNDLSSIAQRIVQNSPLPDPKAFDDLTKVMHISHPDVAYYQFGVPLHPDNSICTPLTDCTGWGSDPAFKTPLLFQGTEIQNSLAVYNGIMRQTLSLFEQDKVKEEASKRREFITKANREGWLMAGSYFFKLAYLNTQNMAANETMDTSSGLNNSVFDPALITSGRKGDNTCEGDYRLLCIWLVKDFTDLEKLQEMIKGKPDAKTASGLALSATQSDLVDSLPKSYVYTPYTGQYASTVYGLFDNSMVVDFNRNQPATGAPPFLFKFNFNFASSIPHVQDTEMKCDSWNLPVIGKICPKKWIADAVYNHVIVRAINLVVSYVVDVLDAAVMAVIYIPLRLLSVTFQDGLEIIRQPSVNPIVSLAEMGVYYINESVKMWIGTTVTSIAIIIVPWVGLVVIPLMIFITPLFLAWVGIMAGVGFLTAYYIPFLPYIIFTFASIGWLIAVIEAMVAAPIVALGVTHPEGEGIFGKGETAILILFNVFLRPSMMIIGYIMAIALTYVGIWIINAGFGNVLSFMQGTGTETFNYKYEANNTTFFSGSTEEAKDATIKTSNISESRGYVGWAGMYGFFFSVILYTMLYLTLVQKSFTLITILPDRVLRWIQGGHAEQVGSETANWGDETRSQITEAGKATSGAQSQAQGKLTSKILGRDDKPSPPTS